MEESSLDSVDDVFELQSQADSLAAELKRLEADLQEARSDLAQFEERYRRTVAEPLAELERLQAQLAALRGKRDPAAEARAEAARRVAEALSPNERKRAMSKAFHPDLAEDDSDRMVREEMIKRMNDAYSRQDWEEFDLVESEIDRLVASRSAPTAARAMLRRAIERFKVRLARVQDTFAEMERSALHALMIRDESARRDGHDLLQEQAADLAERAAVVQSQIRDLQAR